MWPNGTNLYICRVLFALPIYFKHVWVSFGKDSAMGDAATWYRIIMVKESFTSYTESIGSSAESVEMVT
jgi:hypothetical protein